MGDAKTLTLIEVVILPAIRLLLLAGPISSSVGAENASNVVCVLVSL